MYGLELVLCGPRVFFWRWAGAPDWWVDAEYVWYRLLQD